MGSILVSVVTPSYNQGRFLEDCIQSVVGQTYEHIEHIIVDGLSIDETSDILDVYRSHRKVSHIIQEKDNGQSDAINKGFRMAKGEIVGWINSDDYLAPDAIEKSVEEFRKNARVGLTYGDICFVDEQKREIRTNKSPAGLTKKYLLTKNYSVYQQGSFYLAKAVKQAGYLDSRLHFSMDLDLWLKLLTNYEAKYVESVVGTIRLHQETKTSRFVGYFLRDIYRTLSKHDGRLMSRMRCRVLWYALKTGVKVALRQ
jgi:glycosyltransferase involved in cell wall biosynthesis